MKIRIEPEKCRTDKNARQPEKIDDRRELESRYASYFTDESRIEGGHADSICFVQSEQQAAAVLRQAQQKAEPVTVSAGRTGIAGGSSPNGGILLCMEKMNRFLGARWDEKKKTWIIRAEPGLTLAALKELLENKGRGFCPQPDDTELIRFFEESDQWFYAVDPTEKTAHIGGTIAANASGGRSFKYGQTRNHVASIRVILADGICLAISRGRYTAGRGESFVIQTDEREIILPVPDYIFPKVKNTAGYFTSDPLDLIDLFIGSEGTLGIITEAELVLQRKPEFLLSVIAFFPDEKNAVNFVRIAREKTRTGNGQVNPVSLEFFDGRSLALLRKKQSESESGIPPFSESAQAAVFFEQDCAEKNLDSVVESYDILLSDCGISMDETWAAMDDAEQERMTHFRHALPEAVNAIIGQRQKGIPGLHKIGTDLVFPDEYLERMLSVYHEKIGKSGIDYVIFGHIGQNHVHVNLLPSSADELKKAKALYVELAKEAVKYGGSVSGEHGIGKLKTALLPLMYSEKALAEMKAVKKALDPQWILGKGTLFPF